MAPPASRARPKNLDLRTIRLPLTGIVSILHRISGALLFLFGIPLMLVIMQGTLGSREGYDAWMKILSHPLSKLIMLGLIWSFMHHFCAGIRFLLLDLHKGIRLEAARQSSVVVLAASLALTFAAGVFLW
jgi:succinate dehydrogenase / fumarate reductase cytochrome b subunit